VLPSIIIDNSTNFTSSEFKEFAKKLGIQITYASVAYPQTNGQVKKRKWTRLQQLEETTSPTTKARRRRLG
jgi:transposase InsO family protein